MSKTLTATFGVGRVTEKGGARGFVATCHGTFDNSAPDHTARLEAQLLDKAAPVDTLGLPPDLAEKVTNARTAIDNPDPRVAANARLDIDEAIAVLAPSVVTEEPDGLGREFFPVEVIGAVLTLDWTRFAGPKPLAAYQGASFKVTLEAVSVPTYEDAEGTVQPVDSDGGRLVGRAI